MSLHYKQSLPIFSNQVISTITIFAVMCTITIIDTFLFPTVLA